MGYLSQASIKLLLQVRQELLTKINALNEVLKLEEEFEISPEYNHVLKKEQRFWGKEVEPIVLSIFDLDSSFSSREARRKIALTHNRISYNQIDRCLKALLDRGVLLKEKRRYSLAPIN